MADDVSVPAASINLWEVEADGEPARVSISCVVRDVRDSSRVGEAHPDWGAGGCKMWCFG